MFDYFPIVLVLILQYVRQNIHCTFILKFSTNYDTDPYEFASSLTGQVPSEIVLWSCGICDYGLIELIPDSQCIESGLVCNAFLLLKPDAAVSLPVDPRRPSAAVY